MSLLLCVLCSFYLKKYVLLFFCLKTTPRRYDISDMSASIYATDFVRSVKCQPGELTPPYSNEIWSVIPRLSAMRSNCSMVGLSFPQLILFRYCLVQPNLLANSASLMFFLANAFFKSIFVSFFISLWARHSPKQGKKKKDTPSISGSILSNETIILLL